MLMRYAGGRRRNAGNKLKCDAEKKSSCWAFTVQQYSSVDKRLLFEKNGRDVDITAIVVAKELIWQFEKEQKTLPWISKNKGKINIGQNDREDNEMHEGLRSLPYIHANDELY